MKRAVAVLALSLSFAACEQQEDASTGDSGAVPGEVLPGSVSDAMIPLDQLESEAPLAPRQGPSPEELDAEQPVVTPVEGADEGSSGDEAGAASAAPAPETAPEG